MSERPSTRDRDGPARADGLDGLPLLGRHVLRRPAQPRGGGPPGAIGRRARWKSSSIGWPSPASRTFDGLMSMCTRPRSWAYCRPSARQAPIQQIAAT